MEWNYGGNPETSGWYPVLVCFDEQEGAFPQGAFFDGNKWLRKAVVAYGNKCDTQSVAEELAYEHDPGS